MTNTKNTLIAERYADALVSIANTGDLSFEKISNELDSIKQTLVLSSDLSAVLVNPIISSENKKEVLTSVFGNEISIIMLNFLKVLIDKNRFDVFDDILVVFKASLDKINNVKRVEVTSAVAMSDESSARLKSKLESKLKATVILESLINPDIIAGLVIKIGDNVMDMSLKHKLEDLSKNITK